MLNQGSHGKRENETSHSRAYERSRLGVSKGMMAHLLVGSLLTGEHDTGCEASSLDEPFEEESSGRKVEDYSMKGTQS